MGRTPEDSGRDRSSPPPRPMPDNREPRLHAGALLVSGGPTLIPRPIDQEWSAVPGRRITGMTEVLLQAPEIHCDHCKMSIEGAVGSLDGVESVDVAIADATVRVSFDDGRLDLKSIKKTIEDQGYAVFG